MAQDTQSSSLVLGQHPSPRMQQIEWLRWSNLACLLGLIILGVSWELWLAPLQGGSGGALALKVLPLTLGIAGLLKHRLYTCRWLSLLVWIYFTEGVVRASTETGLPRILALAELILSIGLFVGCALYVRLRLKVLPQKDKSSKKTAP